MLLDFHFCFIRCVCECAFAIWIKSLVELSSHFTSLVQIHSLVSLWARYFSCWILFYFSLPFSLSRTHNPILSFTWYCFVSCCVVSCLVSSHLVTSLVSSAVRAFVCLFVSRDLYTVCVCFVSDRLSAYFFIVQLWNVSLSPFLRWCVYVFAYCCSLIYLLTHFYSVLWLFIQCCYFACCDLISFLE